MCQNLSKLCWAWSFVKLNSGCLTDLSFTLLICEDVTTKDAPLPACIHHMKMLVITWAASSPTVGDSPVNAEATADLTGWLPAACTSVFHCQGQKWLFLPAWQSLCERLSLTASELQASGSVFWQIVFTCFQAKWRQMWEGRPWCWKDPGCDKREAKARGV